MKNTLIMILGAAVAAGGLSFYGGMKYARSASSAGAGFQSLRGLSPEERQARLREMGAGAGFGQGRRAGGQAGTGFASGEIISKDDQSVTVKITNNLPAGEQGGQNGSKIIFFSDTTRIIKPAEASPADLAVGDQISASGSANQDGSITAESIQLRPNTPPGR